MAHRPSWFLAPRAPLFDCSPGGMVGLGSIIKDPLRPDDPVTCRPPEELDDTETKDGNIFTDWEKVIEKVRQGRLGLWATFLEIVFGVNTSAEWLSKHSEAFKFEQLESTWFLPTPGFLKKQMKLPLVAECAEKPSTRPNLYIITAILVARVAAVRQSKTDEWKLKLDPELQGSSIGTPGVTAGIDAGLSATSREESSAKMKDFIFAYRLRRILYDRETVESEPYEKGALFDDTIMDHKNTDFRIKPESVRIAPQDLTPRDLHLNMNLQRTLWDDLNDEECECVLPARQKTTR